MFSASPTDWSLRYIPQRSTDHLWDGGGMASGSSSTMLYNKGHAFTKEEEASGIRIFAYHIELMVLITDVSEHTLQSLPQTTTNAEIHVFFKPLIVFANTGSKPLPQE